ncbi:MAG: hypothetical protein F6J93_06990 [Oscillatoria sp. SIO1A7]|nr:hypothetical protein [Oscillatoria sp. SIO1A7]
MLGAHLTLILYIVKDPSKSLLTTPHTPHPTGAFHFCNGTARRARVCVAAPAAWEAGLTPIGVRRLDTKLKCPHTPHPHPTPHTPHPTPHTLKQ